MDELTQIIHAFVLVTAGFKSVTSGCKDIYDMMQGKKKKRRSTAKKNRR